MENSDSTSPERALFCREEEEVVCLDIYDTFQGRVALPAASRKSFPEAADASCRPWKWGIFPGAGDGTTRPWKWALFLGAAPEDAFLGAGEML